VARIRTIKPDFWTDEKVLGIKPLTRLLFIGMWNFADDYGRLEFSPSSLKAKIFPLDPIAADDIRAMLAELGSAGLLLVYSAKGKEYMEITGWHNQKIDKRQTSKIPGPFDDGSSVRGSPPTPADLPRLTPTPAALMEGKGEEGKVDSEAIASGADAPPDPAVPEREFFLRGRQVLGKGAGGLIGKLLKARGGNVALARAAIEQASQKQNPTEYVAAICRGPPAVRPNTAHQQERQTGREILDDIGKYISSSGSEADTGLLRYDPGDGPESLRRGPGGNLVDLSVAGSRTRG
jgi:hypothetical protein